MPGNSGIYIYLDIKTIAFVVLLRIPTIRFHKADSMDPVKLHLGHYRSTIDRRKWTVDTLIN